MDLRRIPTYNRTVSTSFKWIIFCQKDFVLYPGVLLIY
jgi:hypothetical protein